MASDHDTPQQPPDAARYFAAMGLAGALCPWVVAIPLGIWSLREGADGLPWEGVSTALFFLVCISGGGALLGVFGSLLAIAIATALLSLLGLPTGGVRFHAFASGLLGLIPSLALVTMLGLTTGLNGPLGVSANVDWMALLLFFLIGPGIATPLFQFAGAWSTWPASGKLSPMPRWQFGTRQLLVATLWTALALTVARYAVEAALWTGGWTLLWLLYQSLTMWLVLGFLNWWYGRRGGFEGGGGDGVGMRG